MQDFRRDFLKMAGLSMAGGATSLLRSASATAQSGPGSNVATGERPVYFDVRRFGAKGDGTTVDTPAINAAIDAAANVGGGTVMFTAGVYASYSIHLKSNVALFLEQGATILAAPTPYEGTASGGYDAAEPQGAWEPYQDYGHNHWHNSLIWGENLHDFGIFGPGLIWGKGLSRGHNEKELPNTTAGGVGNKAIALKNCRNVILSDFSILQGGWFGILATGVDNLTIDNLKIDTNRDGMDIDCCRNVRVSNCTVNSPWDDGICPKSSFALGYARPTENLTITNCYVTGIYELGTVLDGTWKPMQNVKRAFGTGRIKLGHGVERRLQKRDDFELRVRELPGFCAGDRGRRHLRRHHVYRHRHAQRQHRADFPAPGSASSRTQASDGSGFHQARADQQRDQLECGRDAVDHRGHRRAPH